MKKLISQKIEAFNQMNASNEVELLNLAKEIHELITSSFNNRKMLSKEERYLDSFFDEVIHTYVEEIIVFRYIIERRNEKINFVKLSQMKIKHFFD